jgi:hypothetical protein
MNEESSQANGNIRKAEELVQMADHFSIEMFSVWKKRFPSLLLLKPEHWTFVITIAIVFMTAARLPQLKKEGDVRQRQLIWEGIECGLRHWNPREGIRGFNDCKAFFKRNFEGLIADAGCETPFAASDSVGSWVVWNLFGRPPQDEEARTLVRALGGAVIDAGDYL